jgi:RNA polymerase sigma-70 factor (family 1)
MFVSSSKTDSELLTLTKTGDHAAFTALYSRYWKVLLALAYSHTKDKSIAEEIVQELFVSLWNRKGSIEIQSFGAYMATAVKFSIFKHFNREFRKKQFAESRQVPTVESIDEKQIDARFLQDYIDNIVEQLPERCKLVFKYSRQEGRSNAEIAELMEISEKTVEAHLTKGLKTLKISLKNSGILSVSALVHLFSHL